MLTPKSIVIEKIIEQGILPLFYHDSLEISLDVIRTLYRAGIRVIEYTNRGVYALRNYKLLIEHTDEFPELLLGIGTVKNETQGRDFIAAGARFIVSPVTDPALGQLALEKGLLWIPGTMTPTEINLAHQLGATLLKVFPANILGPSYVSSIKELFPGLQFIPTGGVEIDLLNMQQWFASGVVALGMGSKLISKELLASGSFEILYDRTVEALALCAKARIKN